MVFIYSYLKLYIMSEIELLKESKLLGLLKYIIAFGSDNNSDIVTADPWAPWPFP